MMATWRWGERPSFDEHGGGRIALVILRARLMQPAGLFPIQALSPPGHQRLLLDPGVVRNFVLSGFILIQSLSMCPRFSAMHSIIRGTIHESDHSEY